MLEFVFITDLHLTTTSNVRTGNLLDDVCAKLQYVVDYANEYKCALLLGGDIFDKPSVPDIVKNKILPILLDCKCPVFSINGNHDVLFNSEELADKTSYQILENSRAIRDFTGLTIDFGEVVLTNELPVIQRGKPQIVVYHGFLNQDDGKWTFHYQDIAAGITDPVYILLGHDHVEYEPLQYQKNIKIFRPGSLQRVTREEASNRQPKLLHIRAKDGKLMYKEVDIKARPAEEIFKAKQSTVSKSQQHETYESIIAQIKNANSQNMSFKDAMHTVTTDDVCDYTFKAVEKARYDKQHLNKNL